MKVKSESEVAQSCMTLSNPLDCSLPGSTVHGIFQAKGLQRDTTNQLHFHFFQKNPKTTDEQVPTSRIVVLKLLANSHDKMPIAKQIKMMDRYLG